MKRILIPVMAVAISLAGCGKKPPPDPVEVKGRVVNARGEPVAKMIVKLMATDEANKMGKPLTAATDDQGYFTGKCGPGQYKATVSVMPRGHVGGMPGGGGVPAPLPAEETPGAGTTLDVTIPEGGTQTLEIRIP